jgi:hypothetical protein
MKANEDARQHGNRAQIDRAVSAIIAGRREARIDDIFAAEGGAAVAFAVAQRAVKFPGLADALDRRGLLAAWSGRYGIGDVAGTEVRSTRVARLVEAMRREHGPVEVG